MDQKALNRVFENNPDSQIENRWSLPKTGLYRRCYWRWSQRCSSNQAGRYWDFDGYFRLRCYKRCSRYGPSRRWFLFNYSWNRVGEKSIRQLKENYRLPSYIKLDLNMAFHRNDYSSNSPPPFQHLYALHLCGNRHLPCHFSRLWRTLARHYDKKTSKQRRPPRLSENDGSRLWTNGINRISSRFLYIFYYNGSLWIHSQYFNGLTQNWSCCTFEFKYASGHNFQ